MTKLFRVAIVCGFVTWAACDGDRPAAEPAPQAKPSSLGVQLRTDSAGLVQTRSATGVSVKLDGRYENAMIARRNADGSVTVECHDDTQQAEAFVQATGRDAHNREVQ
jgi:hypothetical protein